MTASELFSCNLNILVMKDISKKDINVISIQLK